MTFQTNPLAPLPFGHLSRPHPLGLGVLALEQTRASDLPLRCLALRFAQLVDRGARTLGESREEEWTLRHRGEALAQRAPLVGLRVATAHEICDEGLHLGIALQPRQTFDLRLSEPGEALDVRFSRVPRQAFDVQLRRPRARIAHIAAGNGAGSCRATGRTGRSQRRRVGRGRGVVGGVVDHRARGAIAGIICLRPAGLRGLIAGDHRLRAATRRGAEIRREHTGVTALLPGSHRLSRIARRVGRLDQVQQTRRVSCVEREGKRSGPLRSGSGSEIWRDHARVTAWSAARVTEHINPRQAGGGQPLPHLLPACSGSFRRRA